MKYEKMATAIAKILRLEQIMDTILRGDYNDQLDLNISFIIDNITNEFNNNLSNLPVCEKFINEDNVTSFVDDSNIIFRTLRLSNLESLMDSCRKMLHEKAILLEDIQQQKELMIFSEDNLAYSFYGENYTYAEVLSLCSKVENFMSCKNLKRTHDFLLKYSNLYFDFCRQINDRKKIIGSFVKATDFQEFMSILKDDNHEVGIIRVEERKNGKNEVYVVAGTRKEMKLSDLIGVPFPADIDREGYYYGHYDDFYEYPYVIKKTFFEKGMTEKHEKMIAQKEKRNSQLLLNKCSGTMGYLYVDVNDDIVESHNELKVHEIHDSIPLRYHYILISDKELIEYGINPEEVNWKPLSTLRIESTISEDDTVVENTKKSQDSITSSSIIQKVKALLKK